MKKRIIVLITLMFVLLISGCSGVFNPITLPAKQVNFEIDGNIYGPETTLGKLIQDGVIEREEYFDELIPADSSDSIVTPYKSYGMKLTVKNNTKSPIKYTDATIIKVTVSEEYGDQANNISILGLTLNDSLDDFKDLLGEPSMEMKNGSGVVAYYWNKISVEGTKQTFEIQVVVSENKIRLIQISFK